MTVKPAWTGQYLQVVVDGPWEYVRRTRGVTAAVILAVTDRREVLLVEQYRVPLGRRCIELPAGLVGDETQGETAAASAKRELEEETGFTAASWEEIGDFASSPGMSAEGFRLFRASGLTRVGNGGGAGAHEDIEVHIVPLGEISAWLQAKREAGRAIDVKLLMLLALT